MSKKGNLTIQHTTQMDLHNLAAEHGSIRVGVTTDLDARIRSYENKGYSGTFYVAPTQNMMQAENRLLSGYDFRHNQQNQSNASDKPGWVYLIRGRKYS